MVSGEALDKAREVVLRAVETADGPISSPRELEEKLRHQGLSEEVILIAVWDLISRGELRLAETEPNLQTVNGNGNGNHTGAGS